MTRLKRFTAPIGVVTALLGVLAVLIAGGATATGASQGASRVSERAFQDEMRKLWEDHVADMLSAGIVSQFPKRFTR